jgi:hypothetical protein
MLIARHIGFYLYLAKAANYSGAIFCNLPLVGSIFVLIFTEFLTKLVAKTPVLINFTTNGARGEIPLRVMCIGI